MPMLLNPFMSFGSNPNVDPYYSSVVLLCHFDGTNGSTTITDNSGSPKTLTAQGNAALSTAQFVFGTASLLLDGTGDYVDTPDNTAFEFGAGDFTIELRVRFAATTDQVLISKWAALNNEYLISLASGDLRFTYTVDGTTNVDINRTWSPSTGVWYAVAVSRVGNLLYMYIDGVLQGSAESFNVTIFPGTAALYIGILGEPLLAGLNGYEDEMRITKGVGRYSSPSYTLATQAFPNS